MNLSKVAIAMSGGVDSSVAAALAVNKYGVENVFGLTMKLFCYGESDRSDKSCCSLDAINDAAAVCSQLGISHYVVNLEKEFSAEVVENFVSEYERGRTPNPCVRCNALIKFQHLLKKAQELGADILVTGHYAQIMEDDGRLHLLKGIDAAKDQSYFLYNLNQEQLSHIWFPLGELTKQETRKLASRYGLKTAQKIESQDICFVSTTTQDFLTRRAKTVPGNMVDKKGTILGKHNGLPFYTIGQRKGLGGGFVEPTYVVGINADTNEVVVGNEKALYSTHMTVGGISWTDKVPVLPAKLNVQIRYNSDASPAVLSSSSDLPRSKAGAKDPEILHYIQNDMIHIDFKDPQKAITPGQTAVFYDKNEAIGGGIIVAADK